MSVAAMETAAAAKTGTSAYLQGGGCNWEDTVLHWVNVVRKKPQRDTVRSSTRCSCILSVVYYYDNCYCANMGPA